MKQPHLEWFESWFDSPYYNALYTHRDENEAQNFVHNLINKLKIKAGAKVADFGCGEGRHAIELHKYGLDVTGLDIAPQRIEAAKAFEQANLRFDVHDMRQVYPKAHFDYIFNFFTSFGYFKTDKETHEAAHSLVAGVKNGGFLIIDYLNAHRSKSRLVKKETLVKSGYQYTINRKVENNRFIKLIEVTDQQQVHHFQEVVAAFELTDFLEIFEPLGVELVAHYGDYELNNFDKNHTPRLIMVFQKRH